MNKNIFFIFFFVLLCSSLVNAETRTVKKNVADEIRLIVEDGNVTIETDSIVDSSKVFHLGLINESRSFSETYDWVIETEFTFVESNLENYTITLTESCNRMFNLSESCIKSFKNITMFGFGYGTEDYKEKYETEHQAWLTCKDDLRDAEKKKDQIGGNHLVALIIGMGLGYLISNWKKFAKSPEGGGPPSPRREVETTPLKLPKVKDGRV